MSQLVATGASPKWKAVPRSALHLSGGTSSPGYPRSHENGPRKRNGTLGTRDLAERGGESCPAFLPRSITSPPSCITPRAPALANSDRHAYTARALAYQSSNMVKSSADNPSNALQATHEEPYTKDEL
ncbi:hypothetical protein BU15DRAFT_65883 [Melanogaster broomeanus]|nr:hypothetical protein BU15DRAFT_65883 [Melanogaster broomeanus]